MAELSKFAEEIMVEILSRLSAKSLMRFKCVRRSWNAMMNNPNFVAKHLSSSKRTALSSSSTTLFFRRFLISDQNPNETEIVLSLFNFCSDFEGWFVEDIHFPDFLGIECRGIILNEGVDSLFQIVCHCDGIICLADYGQKPNVVLCNPATKEFKLLPESQLPLTSPELFPTAAVGFGYDLRLKNYKVVRLIHGGRNSVDQGMVNHPIKAEVYDFLTNCWKEIKSDSLVKEKTIFFPDSNSRTKGIYFEGSIFWTALERGKFLKFYGQDGYRMEDDDHIMNAYVISFDLADETFHITMISPYSECCLILSVLGFWKESIALCVRSGCNYSIWLMDDSDGGNCSWTKYFEVDPVVKLSSHFAVFGKSEEPFVLVAASDVDSSEQIVFYDIRTNKFNYLHLNGKHLYSTQIVDYVSSIVSLNESNKLDMVSLNESNKLDMGA